MSSHAPNGVIPEPNLSKLGNTLYFIHSSRDLSSLTFDDFRNIFPDINPNIVVIDNDLSKDRRYSVIVNPNHNQKMFSSGKNYSLETIAHLYSVFNFDEQHS